MVDVDDPSGERGGKVLRQDLHVAGEHDEIDALLRNQRGDRPLLPLLGARRDRKMEITAAPPPPPGGAWPRDWRSPRRVPSADGRWNCDRADRSGNGRSARRGSSPAASASGRAAASPDRIRRQRGRNDGRSSSPYPVRCGEGDPHEEAAALGIAILRALDDIAVLTRDRTRDAGNDAAPVDARKREHEARRFGGHGAILAAGETRAVSSSLATAPPQDRDCQGICGFSLASRGCVG